MIPGVRGDFHPNFKMTELAFAPFLPTLISIPSSWEFRISHPLPSKSVPLSCQFLLNLTDK